MTKDFFEEDRPFQYGLVIALIVLICIGLFGLFRAANHRQNEALLPNCDAGQSTALETTAPQNPGFYGKLQRGEDVHILVVGDGIAGGTGLRSREDRWSELLTSQLSEGYAGTITCTNAALEGADGYAACICAMEEQEPADLVIVCVGSWDSKAALAFQFEALLRAIHQRDPDCAILAVMEHPLAEEPQKAKLLRELCTYYDIPTVDMAFHFQESDGILVQRKDSYPNKMGHRLYAAALEALIRALWESDASVPLCPEEPLNPSLPALHEYQYVSAEEFTRTGNTFRLSRPIDGILGMDFHLVIGRNNVKILADGILLDTKTGSHTSAEPLRRICLVDEVQIEEYLELIFIRREEADAFRGILIHPTNG